MRNLEELEKYRDKGAERELAFMLGDDNNGIFKILVGNRSFFVIASDGGGWDHVSVTYRNDRGKCPTWEEMCEIKKLFFYPEEAVVEYHPAEKDYVNDYPTCLHLWRPNDGRELPTPPPILVGVGRNTKSADSASSTKRLCPYCAGEKEIALDYNNDWVMVRGDVMQGPIGKPSSDFVPCVDGS